MLSEDYDIFGSENVMNKNVKKWIDEKCNILIGEKELDINHIIDFNTENHITEFYDNYSETTFTLNEDEENEKSKKEFIYNVIYNKVVSRILNNSHKNELSKILYENLIFSENSCNVGKFAILLSTLNGFYDDMELNFIPSEYFQQIISNIFNDYNNEFITFEDAKYLVKKYTTINNKNFDEWFDVFDKARYEQLNKVYKSAMNVKNLGELLSIIYKLYYQMNLLNKYSYYTIYILVVTIYFLLVVPLYIAYFGKIILFDYFPKICKNITYINFAILTSWLLYNIINKKIDSNQLCFRLT